MCPSCGELLEVEYDLAHARIGNAGPPMERFRDLLPIRSAESILDGGEGNTRCLHARELGRAVGLDNLWVKVEADNPTRTTKDRQGTVVIAALRELGVREFVTASTGNSCTAMARIVARFPDMRMHAFVGDEFLQRVAHAEAPNISVYWLPHGSFVDACEAAAWLAARSELARDGGFFFFAKREALKTVYLEAAAQVSREIEVYVQAVSSGIGVYATSRAARELVALGYTRTIPRLVCVQEATCDPMVRSFGRGAGVFDRRDVVARPRGLATPTHRGDPSRSYPYVRAAVLTSNGTMLSVGADTMREMRELAMATEGLEICYASAMTIAAARDLARSGRVRTDAVVLLNLTGAERPPSTRRPDYVVERRGEEWIMTIPTGVERDDVLEGVVAVLRQSQRLRRDLPLGAETVLLETGLALDSVALLELLLGLENHFERRIEEHEVTMENFRTIGAVARFVAAKLER